MRIFSPEVQYRLSFESIAYFALRLKEIFSSHCQPESFAVTLQFETVSKSNLSNGQNGST